MGEGLTKSSVRGTSRDVIGGLSHIYNLLSD